eukprot:905741-Karenia_brevis.AAC.1
MIRILRLRKNNVHPDLDEHAADAAQVVATQVGRSQQTACATPDEMFDNRDALFPSMNWSTSVVGAEPLKVTADTAFIPCSFKTWKWRADAFPA